MLGVDISNYQSQFSAADARALRDYQAPPYLAYTWNAAGFTTGRHLPLPRMSDDEGYD